MFVTNYSFVLLNVLMTNCDCVTEDIENIFYCLRMIPEL